MNDNKLLLYAIYFKLLNIYKVSFVEVPGDNYLIYYISLILITLSIIKDIYSGIKNIKK